MARSSLKYIARRASCCTGNPVRFQRAIIPWPRNTTLLQVTIPFTSWPLKLREPHGCRKYYHWPKWVCQVFENKTIAWYSHPTNCFFAHQEKLFSVKRYIGHTSYVCLCFDQVLYLTTYFQAWNCSPPFFAGIAPWCAFRHIPVVKKLQETTCLRNQNQIV